MFKLVPFLLLLLVLPLVLANQQINKNNKKTQRQLTPIQRIKRLSPQDTTDLTVCINVLPYNRSVIVSDRICLEFYQNVTNTEYNSENAKSLLETLNQLQIISLLDY